MLLLGQFFVDPPVITSPPAGALDPGTEDAAYSVTINATGTGTLVFSIVDGALPAGITLDPDTGIISGTTSDPDIYDFTVRVRDTYNQYYDRAYSLTIAAGGLPGTPTIIFDIPAQTDITGSEYNSLEDSSGNGYDAAYISGGKGTKSAALQLDGNDTLLTQNNGFNDGTMYRTAGGVLLNAQIFPTGVGTTMFVGAVKAFKHLFTSVDFVMGGGMAALGFCPVGFVNGSNVTRYTSNGITKDEVSAPTLDTYYVFTTRFNATNLRGQVDNNTELTQAGDARVNLAQPMQFFFRTSDAGCFEGYVAFIVCWPTVLNDTEVTQAKNYLKGRFPSLNV